MKILACVACGESLFDHPPIHDGAEYICPSCKSPCKVILICVMCERRFTNINYLDIHFCEECRFPFCSSCVVNKKQFHDLAISKIEELESDELSFLNF